MFDIVYTANAHQPLNLLHASILSLEMGGGALGCDIEGEDKAHMCRRGGAAGLARERAILVG